jgi:hypothetical protein
LKEVVLGIKRDFKKEVQTVRPRVHSLDSLLKIHQEVTERPFMLMGGLNEKRRVYALKLLEGFIDVSKRLKNEN